MREAKGSTAFDVAFAIGVGTTLLVSFYSLPYDFSLMILPLLICAPGLATSSFVPKQTAYLILTLGYLFFLTPLYYLLLTTSNMAWFFLVGSVAIWSASRWGMIDEQETLARRSAV